MPNHPSVIARPTDTGFAGRYVHNEGHPVARISLLRALYAGPFAGDLDAMTKFLIDDHPAGWSQLGLNPTVDTGWDNGRSSVYHHDFVCYCHGDRNDEAYLRTDDNTDIAQADWVYVLRPDGIEVIDLDDGDAATVPWQATEEDIPWTLPEVSRPAPFYEPVSITAGSSNDGSQVFATLYDSDDRCQACFALSTDMAEAFAQSVLAAVKENRETRAAYTYTSDALPTA